MDKNLRLHEGVYLKDEPIVTSVGIFEYLNDDGSKRRELRLPENVFDPASLASYEGKPVIITHDAGEVDKNNVQREIIGTILSPGIRDGDDVRAKIVIHNTDAMKRSGLKELSLATPWPWMRPRVCGTASHTTRSKRTSASTTLLWSRVPGQENKRG